MKRILFMAMASIVLFACQDKIMYHDRDNEYLVYTSPSEDVDFKDFLTYEIPDSLLVIGSSDKPYYSKSENAKTLINAFKSNMNKLGYVDAAGPGADLRIQVTYIMKTERFIHYYEYPYWWLDYPGYWGPDYWAPGYWVPGYWTDYVISSNALIADMVDLRVLKDSDDDKKVIWSAFACGPAGYSLNYDLKRMNVAINQAFVQSPYLKRSESL